MSTTPDLPPPDEHACVGGVSQPIWIESSVREAVRLAARASVPAEKIAPVQGYAAGIPWSLHLEAYDAYSKKWGPQRALIEGGCRGGFGPGELDDFIPGWRDRVSEIGKLRARVAELERTPPDEATSRAQFEAWLLKYPASMRANVLEAADRSESMTWDAWQAARTQGDAA